MKNNQVKSSSKVFLFRRNQLLYITVALLCPVLFFSQCSDDYEEEFDVEEYYPGTYDDMNYESWIAMYGGLYDEEFEGIIATDDECFLVAGGSDSHTGWDDMDGSLVKVDFHGNIVWSKAYGLDKDDMFIDVEKTNDGNYIAAGWTKSFGEGNADFWLVKIDNSGNVLWQKSIGGSRDEQAWSVAVGSDGSLLLCGGTRSFGAGKSDIWLVKLSSGGDIQWQKSYGGSDEDAPPGDYEEYVARAFFDGDGQIGFSASSYSFGNGKGDVLVARANALDGEVVWSKSYGGSAEDNTWDFIKLEGDSYLLPCWTEDLDLGMAFNWIVNIAKEDGSILWQQRFGNPDYWSEPLGAAALSSGGAVLACYYEKSNSDWYTVIAKIDNTGTLAWSNEIKYGTLDWPNAAVETQDGTIGIAGVATTDDLQQELAIFHLNAEGETGSNCDILSAINYTPNDPGIEPVSVSLEVSSTDASPEPTECEVIDISIGRNYLCYK
ncbi:MAG: hypothetical protein K9J30_02905 [Bacteroidales bacterium]|nr:hypothetical protein [Bacteroidales bacterium]